MRKHKLLILSISLAIVLGACTPTPTIAPPSPTAVPATSMPEPTPVPPTPTPEPTPVPEVAHIVAYISPDPLAAALEEAFEAERGDVLTVVSGPWCRRLKSEQEAGDIQADVIYGAEPIFYMGLRESGALLPYTSPQVANSKPEYQWDETHFALADVRYISIIYNENMVDVADVPTTIDGLTDPRWANMLVVPDATQCAAAFAIAAGLVQPDLDYSFFEGARANNALLSDRASNLPALVASGEAALGVGPHDPVLRLWSKAEREGGESPVAIVWPEDGVLSIPRPIAIIADENRSEAATRLAQELVDFVLSPQGQNIAVRFGFVPVREGIELPEGVPGDLEIIEIDWAWAQANKRDIQASFESIMYGE